MIIEHTPVSLIIVNHKGRHFSCEFSVSSPNEAQEKIDSRIADFGKNYIDKYIYVYGSAQPAIVNLAAS